VRWGDLNTYQGRQLLPKTKDHDLSYQDPFFTTCFQSCHSFQTRMTPTAFDEEGWRQRVKYMRDTMMVGEGPRLSDEKARGFRFLPHHRLRSQLAQAANLPRRCRSINPWCVRSARPP